ncbi:hypothetical protein D3C80_1670690 [compost metagenome]
MAISAEQRKCGTDGGCEDGKAVRRKFHYQPANQWSQKCTYAPKDGQQGVDAKQFVILVGVAKNGYGRRIDANEGSAPEVEQRIGQPRVGKRDGPHKSPDDRCDGQHD